MGSSDVEKKNYKDAQKYSMWAAVTCGISIVLLIVVLILYVHSARIMGAAHGALGRAQNALNPYVKQ